MWLWISLGDSSLELVLRQNWSLGGNDDSEGQWWQCCIIWECLSQREVRSIFGIAFEDREQQITIFSLSELREDVGVSSPTNNPDIWYSISMLLLVNSLSVAKCYFLLFAVCMISQWQCDRNVSMSWKHSSVHSRCRKHVILITLHVNLHCECWGTIKISDRKQTLLRNAF